MRPQVRWSHQLQCPVPGNRPAAHQRRLHPRLADCRPAVAVAVATRPAATAVARHRRLLCRCPAQRCHRPHCRQPEPGCRLSQGRCCYPCHSPRAQLPQAGTGSAACCTTCPPPRWCCLGWGPRQCQTRQALWPGWSTQTRWTPPCNSAWWVANAAIFLKPLLQVTSTLRRSAAVRQSTGQESPDPPLACWSVAGCRCSRTSAQSWQSRVRPCPRRLQQRQ